MSNHAVEQRHQLFEAVAAAFLDDADWDSHVVCGFALVVEFAGPGGERGVAARSSDATGETDLTPWAAQGLLEFALSEDMFDPRDDGVDESD